MTSVSGGSSVSTSLLRRRPASGAAAAAGRVALHGLDVRPVELGPFAAVPRIKKWKPERNCKVI